MSWQSGTRTVKYKLSTDAGFTSKSNASQRRRQSRPRNSGKNNYSHLNEHDQVATSRVSRLVVGSMTPITQNMHTRFNVQSAPSNPRLMDAPPPSDLVYIFRLTLTNALPECASTSNCSAWHHCLLALPSSPDHAQAPILRSFKEKQLDAVLVTVLLETPTLLRCLLPHIFRKLP
jgi:hypothetical protein